MDNALENLRQECRYRVNPYRTQTVPDKKRKEKHDRNKLKEKDRKAKDTGLDTEA